MKSLFFVSNLEGLLHLTFSSSGLDPFLQRFDWSSGLMAYNYNIYA